MCQKMQSECQRCDKCIAVTVWKVSRQVNNLLFICFAAPLDPHLPSVIAAPPGSSTEVGVSLHVAGGPGAKCRPVWQTGRIHHTGDRDGPRASGLWTDGSADPGTESLGEWLQVLRLSVGFVSSWAHDDFSRKCTLFQAYCCETPQMQCPHTVHFLVSQISLNICDITEPNHPFTLKFLQNYVKKTVFYRFGKNLYMLGEKTKQNVNKGHQLSLVITATNFNKLLLCVF